MTDKTKITKPEIVDLERDTTELIDRIAMGEYGFLLLRRDDQILAYSETYHAQMPKTVFLISNYYYDSVIKSAERHKVTYVAPEKSKVQAEYESWRLSLGENSSPSSTDYLTYIQTITKELAHGVMSRYWDNELFCHNELFQLQITNDNPGRSRLWQYLFFRIEQPISKNSSMVGKNEKLDSEWLLDTMVALGYANKIKEDDFDKFVMTNAAFELLREPSWFEKYHSKTAFVLGSIGTIGTIILSIKEMSKG